MDFDMNAANIAMLKGYVSAARPMEEITRCRFWRKRALEPTG